MAEESEDESSKTEEASQKKLDEARKKGQLASTRELNHFFVLLGLTFLIGIMASTIGRDTVHLLTPYLSRPDQFQINAGTVGDTLKETLTGIFLILLVPMIAALVAALAPNIVQNKWVFATDLVKPKFSKISPFSGFKRIYSGRAFIEFLKSLLKILIVCAIAYICAAPFRDYLDMLSDQGMMGILELTHAVALEFMIAVCVFLFLVGVGDYFLQRHIFLKSMRMTKQEQKDEYKQQEGDPHIKQKLKQIRREKARRRMMANVPKADVVITNPTHFAVALQYDAKTMSAPKLVAKGADDVAARIRKLAMEHKVPIIRNPPLARILYDTTDLDQIIPTEHFQAVAKIIGYVYRLKGKTPPAAKAKPTMQLRK
jgi:flagellar biosynthetic protein FlhB